MTLEETILSSLVYNQLYARNVIPYIEPMFFEETGQQVVAALIREHFGKYSSFPSKEVLEVETEGKKLNDDIYKKTKKVIADLKPTEADLKWLVDSTETFCRNRAMWTCLKQAVLKFQDKKITIDDLGDVPDQLKKAFSIRFDESIGHNYIDDAQERFEFYHSNINRAPFSLEFLNTITKGGLPNKTMLVLLGGTGGGKTLTMCHCAADWLMQGKNVLYISMEMSAEYISQRVDMNLLDVTEDELMAMPEDVYLRRIAAIKGQTAGDLTVKQYPAKGAHSGHFRRLIQEMINKKGIKPDILIVDYLNICASSSKHVDKYDVVKSVTEEVRGLGVEFDMGVLTGTQVNREGFGSTEIDLTNTSDSFGIPFTADYMVAMWATEEMKKLGQMGFGQLKNRYGDVSHPAKSLIGVNFGKMKLYNLENVGYTAQTEDINVFDSIAEGKPRAAPPSSVDKIKDFFT